MARNEEGSNQANVIIADSPILRNIALSFVALTVLLAGAVIYLALGRAVISVDLAEVGREVSFKINLVEAKLGQPLPARAVAATFVETVDSLTDTFVPSGAGDRTGRAGGSVTIHNETDRDQPLVATTRLLTSDGKLFRLQSSVRVPARGTVTTIVAADQDGAEYEIGPTRFTIPGLNATLQSVIYATSSAAMVRGATEQKVVTAEDLETAKQSLQSRLLAKIRQDLSKQLAMAELSDQDFIVLTSEVKTSVNAGAKANSFTVTLNLKVVAVKYDRAEVLKQIQEASGGIGVSSFDKVKATLDNYEATSKTAVLSGTALGQTTISASSSIFDPANFVGLEPIEVENFLKNYDGVESVKVELSPYWINKLPKLPSRIQVVFN